MSEKLPRVTANAMIKIIETLGFHLSRQSDVGLSVDDFKKML